MAKPKKASQPAEVQTLSQDQINAIIAKFNSNINGHIRFTMDSRGLKLFIQNTSTPSYKDARTGKELQVVTRSSNQPTIEDAIVDEVLHDVKVIVDNVGFFNVHTYSYTVFAYKQQLDKTWLIQYNKSIAVK